MENNENRFIVRDVIIKVLLVLLFVFLLIWLFPMPNLNPVYNRIFGENIKTMSEAAKGYFTLERLPKKVGDKVTLTLEEMLENKMILPFVDSDNKACDSKKSYVEVIRMENEFLFKTTLSCPSKTDYIVEYVGCYDICGDSCTVKDEKELLTQYQLYKETSKDVIDSYSCSTGYTLDGKLCIKKTSTTDNKTATTVCSSGYTYNPTSKTCTKAVTDTKTATITCATGYIYNSTSKTCLKVTGETVAATTNCSTGYTYNPTSKTCIKTTTDSYTSSPVCPTGYTLSGTSCIKTTADSYTSSPVCPTGYTYDSITKACSSAATTRYDATPVCPIGYKIDGSRCSVTMNTMIDADPVCSTGYIYSSISDKCEKSGIITTYSNWVCSNEIYSEKQSVYSGLIASRTYLSTSYGYDGCVSACYMPYYTYEECYRSATYTQGIVDAYTPTKFTCPMGVPSSDPRYCDVYTVSYKYPTSYTCSEGRLDGTFCYVTYTDYKLPTYSCSTGYILNGKTCSKTTTDAKAPVYSCLSGYTLNGKICSKTTTDTKAPTYSCLSGYTLNGTTCSKTTTNIIDTKDAIAKYKSIVSKEYKWSPSKTLEGWISTGKTRIVEL